MANGTSKNVGLGKFWQDLGSVFDKSRSLVFVWFVFTFFESRNLLPKSLGLGFLTRISASRRVSDFTIRHPSMGAPDQEYTPTLNFGSEFAMYNDHSSLLAFQLNSSF